MALPKQSAPTYILTVPSTGKKLKFRPFLVREEKALMLAEQSEDLNFMVETLKDIIDSCTFGKANMESLAIFDLEYILIKLRSKSVGEVVELRIPCDQCKKHVEVKGDISKLSVKRSSDHDKKIPLFDEVGIVMKYPSIDVLQNLKDEYDELALDAMLECIDYVYDKDAIHYAKDQSKEELTDFMLNLTKEQFTKIENFFKTMPTLEMKLDFTCPSCGAANSKIATGLQDFF